MWKRIRRVRPKVSGNGLGDVDARQLGGDRDKVNAQGGLVWRFGEEFLLEAEVVNQPSHELPVLVVHADDDAHVVMNVGVGGDGGSNEGMGTTQGGNEGEEEAKVSVAMLMNANDGNDEDKAAHHPMDDTNTSTQIPPNMVAKRIGRCGRCLGL